MYIPVSSELVKSTGLQQNEAESQPRKYVMSGRKKCMHKHHFVPDAYTTVSKATKETCYIQNYSTSTQGIITYSGPNIQGITFCSQ